LLQLKSEVFEKKVIGKIHELKNLSGYVDSMRKEQEIDDNYSKVIKAKLALAQLS